MTLHSLLQNKSGTYEDRLLMKILARHFDLIAHIDTSWLPSQEPFTAMVLALISVRLCSIFRLSICSFALPFHTYHSFIYLIFDQYIRALNLWSTGVFDTKESAAAMNDDKWGAEAEKQAKRLRAVMAGKPEKWKTIVLLAKAEMKRSTPARSHRTEIENDDSGDEPVFLSGDEVDAERESEGEGKGDGDGDGDGSGEGKHEDDEDEDVVEIKTDGKLVGEAQTRKKSPRVDREAMRKGGSSEGEGVRHDKGETVEDLGKDRGATRKGEGVEHGRAEEEVDEVSTPVAPKPKKARSGKAKAKTDVRLGSPRDVGGANGGSKEVTPTVRRKRKAVLVESEPEDEEDATLDAGRSAAESVKRRKVDRVRAADGQDIEHM